jgi:hypothetical protein
MTGPEAVSGELSSPGQLGRRGFLAAAASLPIARAANRVTPQPRSGTPGLVGATITPAAMNCRGWPTAVTAFDWRAGVPMATSCSRMYWSEGQWQTGPNEPLAVAERAAQCDTMVLSFRPPRGPFRQAAADALQRSIKRCQQAGATIESVVLWHEFNDFALRRPPFPTAGEYHRYCWDYGPAVTELGVSLGYMPLVLSTLGPAQLAYFPGTERGGSQLVSRVYADYYCHAQYAQGIRLDACMELARRHGLPLGLGEFGGTNGTRRAPDQLFARFMSYLTGVFAARLDKGLDNAACMYFCGGPQNVPTVAQYNALRRFYNSVAASPRS